MIIIIKGMLKFIASGAIAGILSAFIAKFDFYILPGIIFGLAIGSNYIKRISAQRIALFTIFSAIAYFAAVITTMKMTPSWLYSNTNNEISSVIYGAFVGTLLLIISFSLVIQRVKIYYFLPLLILGTLSGLSLFAGRDLLFIVWQTGMAAGLSLVYSSNKPVL